MKFLNYTQFNIRIGENLLVKQAGLLKGFTSDFELNPSQDFPEMRLHCASTVNVQFPDPEAQVLLLMDASRAQLAWALGRKDVVCPVCLDRVDENPDIWEIRELYLPPGGIAWS